jgi:cytochrome P450
MLEDDTALPPERSELDIIKDVTGVAYLAGSDTTVAAVHSYFLAMLIWPDIQAKAQAQIDRVVGQDRLPEFDDAPRMPYVQGIINECLRWIPVVPMCKSPQS